MTPRYPQDCDREHGQILHEAFMGIILASRCVRDHTASHRAGLGANTQRAWKLTALSLRVLCNAPPNHWRDAVGVYAP